MATFIEASAVLTDKNQESPTMQFRRCSLSLCPQLPIGMEAVAPSKEKHYNAIKEMVHNYSIPVSEHAMYLNSVPKGSGF
jgi:hypothetical protein